MNVLCLPTHICHWDHWEFFCYSITVESGHHNVMSDYTLVIFKKRLVKLYLFSISYLVLLYNFVIHDGTKKNYNRFGFFNRFCLNSTIDFSPSIRHVFFCFKMADSFKGKKYTQICRYPVKKSFKSM